MQQLSNLTKSCLSLLLDQHFTGLTSIFLARALQRHNHYANEVRARNGGGRTWNLADQGIADL